MKNEITPKCKESISLVIKIADLASNKSVYLINIFYIYC